MEVGKYDQILNSASKEKLTTFADGSHVEYERIVKVSFIDLRED